jgi:hypothetical protein
MRRPLRALPCYASAQRLKPMNTDGARNGPKHTKTAETARFSFASRRPPVRSRYAPSVVLITTKLLLRTCSGVLSLKQDTLVSRAALPKAAR